jgi:hypothetical protein
MTPRTILILALRILGFWCLVIAVSGISYAVAIAWQYFVAFASGRGPPPGLRSSYYSNYGVAIAFVQPVLHLTLAAILGLGAPAIASLYYRREAPPDASTAGGELTLAAVYRIVIQGLGVFTCLRAVSPIATAITTLGMSGGFQSSNAPREFVMLLEAILYIVVGAVLIGLAGPLARWATISRSWPVRRE